MKFIYDDKVKVIDGFYKGQTGVVKERRTAILRYSPNTYFYTVRSADLKFENIPEEYLEKI